MEYREELSDELKIISARYENRIQYLETEIRLMKEQLMAQRNMLKDAIQYGDRLSQKLNDTGAQ